MPSTIDKIVEGFPFPTIDPIIGEPNYEKIAEVHLKLNSNAASVQSNLGCGTLGLLYLTLKPAVYATVAANNTPFVPPVNPGALAAIPDTSTAAQIASFRYDHKIATDLFTEYDRTDKALRQLLISSVDETFIRALRQKYIGYSTLTTLDFLSHLYKTYANISPSDLQDNDARLRAPYDANHPIETLVDQVDNAVEYAAAGDTPYTPQQVVSIAFQLVYQTGLFLDDCKIWKRKDAADKTWSNFKSFFATAHQDWRESQATTTGANFHSANHVYQQDTVDAIANLATATASDRASVAALTATNGTLSTDLAACNAKLVLALQEITKLTTTAADLRRRQPGTSGNRPDTSNLPPGHYCFTHGFRSKHASHKCENPGPNHERNATKADTKGGSSANRTL